MAQKNSQREVHEPVWRLKSMDPSDSGNIVSNGKKVQQRKWKLKEFMGSEEVKDQTWPENI